MPYRRDHTQASKHILGSLSLGEDFQRLFDRHQPKMGPLHRNIDHTWERIESISKLYGEISDMDRQRANAEMLIHLALDYKLVPAWVKKFERKK